MNQRLFRLPLNFPFRPTRCCVHILEEQAVCAPCALYAVFVVEAVSMGWFVDALRKQGRSGFRQYGESTFSW